MSQARLSPPPGPSPLVPPEQAASMMSLSRTSSAASVSTFDTQEEDFPMAETLGLVAALSRHEMMEGISTAADSMFANEAMAYPMIPPFERDDPPRRTRKRFSSAQLMMLEHLFHQTSHPTREQREFLAREANIELRSVTVWFQNKRQTERKVALQSAAGGVGNPQDASHLGVPSSSNFSSSGHSKSRSGNAKTSLGPSSSPMGRTVRSHASLSQLSSSNGAQGKRGHDRARSGLTVSLSSPFPLDFHEAPTKHIRTDPRKAKPSLDHIASRAEQRTPTRASRSLPALPSKFPQSQSSRQTNEMSGSGSSIAALWANSQLRTPANSRTPSPSAHSSSNSQSLVPTTPPRSLSSLSPFSSAPSSPGSSSSSSITRDLELVDFAHERGKALAGQGAAAGGGGSLKWGRIGGRRPTLEYACAAARVKGHAKLWMDDSEDEDIDIRVTNEIARKPVRSRTKQKRKEPRAEGAMDVDDSTPRPRSQPDLNLTPNPNPDPNTNTNPSAVTLNIDVGGDTETEIDMETETELSMQTRTLNTPSIRVEAESYNDEENGLVDADDEEDEDEVHEAITPHSSQGSLSGSRRGDAGKTQSAGQEKSVVDDVFVDRDDDTMDAALALCGLSGRR